MTKVLFIFLAVALILFFFLKKNNSSINKKLLKKAILVFLGVIITIFLFIKYYNRILPIEFKFEKFENDSIVISSNKNLSMFKETNEAVRYTLICPISNNDLTFSQADNNEISLESELDFDFSNENVKKTIIVKNINNRYYYKAQISIIRNNEIYKKSTLTNKEILYYIKKKGDSLQCNIGVMYYFFPLPKYSPVFYIPSDSLINYLKTEINKIQ